ncbi:hypothetical protein NKH77_41605 [Streptomyces sp. M19]
MGTQTQGRSDHKLRVLRWAAGSAVLGLLLIHQAVEAGSGQPDPAAGGPRRWPRRHPPTGPAPGRLRRPRRRCQGRARCRRPPAAGAETGRGPALPASPRPG